MKWFYPRRPRPRFVCLLVLGGLLSADVRPGAFAGARSSTVSGHAAAMEKGLSHWVHTGPSGHWTHPIDYPAARLAFQSALEQAETASERRAARLALARALLVDARGGDPAAARALYLEVLADGDPGPAEKAEAALGLTESYLQDGNHDEARMALSRAADVSRDIRWTARAEMLRARLHLQQREYDDARVALIGLLDLPDTDRQRRWEAQTLLDVLSLLPRLREDQPRLFFNRETWPDVRERALTVERPLLDLLQDRVQAIDIEAIQPGNWGLQAMEAAMVYRLTCDPDTLDKARRMLRATTDALLNTISYNNRSYHRIGLMAAFDWLQEDLPTPEREMLAADLLTYLVRLANDDTVRGRLARVPHYYEREVYWYGGLALFDPGAGGVDYANMLRILAIGYGHNRDAMDERLAAAGNDGAWQVNLGYALAELPVSHNWNFLHAWQSALDDAIPPEWVHIGVSPDYALRQILPMPPSVDWRLNHFGYSRTMSSTRSDLLYDHLAHYQHFFGRSHPGPAAVAQVLRRRLLAASEPDIRRYGQYPVFRFLMTGRKEIPAAEIPHGMPWARHFSGVGQVLMSSGFGPEDTYALFIVGGGVASTLYTTASNHFDAHHFSLFRQGFLAVDSGVMSAGEHTANYANQTVAHNAMLIHMPGEVFPGIPSNSGGQNRRHHAARVLAFESREHYAYAASDATATYHEDKCEQMVRQFLFVPPRHVVVFDRVTATQPDYSKTWLLHTAHEPLLLEDRAFRADAGKGRIFCRTILPADAVLEKVGGPGREFWADGRSWPVEEAWWQRTGRFQDPDSAGRWRVEVSPGAVRHEDLFLHLIQTADQDTDAMTPSEWVETGETVTLSFRDDTRDMAVTLNKSGPVGGHIRISEQDRVLVDRPLAQDVMPQHGLALQPATGTDRIED